LFEFEFRCGRRLLAWALIRVSKGEARDCDQQERFFSSPVTTLTLRAGRGVRMPRNRGSARGYCPQNKGSEPVVTFWSADDRHRGWGLPRPVAGGVMAGAGVLCAGFGLMWGGPAIMGAV
jgi:hypothetical protein